jgi:hypothetical protein
VLEARFGISGPALRQIVNRLRGQGVPICSDEKGYYYAASETELRATIRQLSGRIAGIENARNGLLHALKSPSESRGEHGGTGPTREPDAFSAENASGMGR